ncbi:glycine cleavage system aminomethyltransferase GcvT [Lentilitoribacter sp. EG35]|uniref:glycine cleavage system aminomethyltransferase GcvT n=1 Tax=Lentilitoribacter sp. EG35 TaxID=3234192 RepID=UPI0034609454
MLKTPLYDFHVAHGAKMVPFAGYNMPVQYPLGVMGEHTHTREKAGLFDVSHMGQVLLRAKSGDNKDAALALETLVPMDILGLGEERQRYALFTADDGGILDDLMVTNRGDHLYLVINAARKDHDIGHLQSHISDHCEIEVIEDRALIALQGPLAETALIRIFPQVATMRFMDNRSFMTSFGEVWISRSGYTGEDGYEISISSDRAEEFADKLTGMDEVEPIGLGARDSLRLEGGLCLYGNDIDESTSPTEATLNWSIQKVRRDGGERAGGFLGEAVILPQLVNGTSRKRVGILPEGRAPMRGGTLLFASETGEEPIGKITSGGFGPTLGQPVSMGYLHSRYAIIGTKIFADVRGKRLPASVASLPFVKANFKR